MMECINCMVQTKSSENGKKKSHNCDTKTGTGKDDGEQAGANYEVQDQSGCQLIEMRTHSSKLKM